MTQNIDISTKQLLKTGRLKKTGGTYLMVLLNEKDIPQMLALQDVALDALTPQEQTFLHHKTPEDLKKHFKYANNMVLGIVHNGQLVAQSMIVNPTPSHPNSGMSDLKLDVRPEKISTIMGVIVDPAYRGNKLMTVMVDEWLASAKADGRTHALAEVTVENHHSWSVFMKEGLQIKGIGHDDSDNSDVYNMHAFVSHLIKKRARGDFNKVARKTVKCGMNQLLPQKSLLRQGYVGVGFDASNQNIETPSKVGAGSMPYASGSVRCWT